jgi:hypothetical protein
VTERPSVVVAPVERWVDRRELARLLGVSVSTIKRWHGEDPPIPSESWGMKRTRRYLPSACITWAQGRPSKMRASRDRDSTAPEQQQPKE